MAISTDTDLKVVQRINLPGGVEAINIYYFHTQFDEDVLFVNVIDDIEDWIEALYTTMVGAISDQVTLGNCTVYEWNVSLLRWDNLGEGTPSVTFTAVGDMLPHGVAALVRAYSEDSRTIARKYIAGATEETQEDGDWTAAMLTTLALFGNAWDNDINLAANKDLLVGVFTTRFNFVIQLSGVEVILAQPAYQRRRRPGVGS